MKKALVVGINNYPDAPLHGCVRDATDFGELISRNDDQSRNFDVLLKTDIVRKQQLMGWIHDLFSGQNETALLYFSGHGFVNDLGGFLVTPDHKKYEEGISMYDILALANQSATANRIIILDCCHSGAITDPGMSIRNTGYIAEGVTLLTASKKNEIAMEVKGKGVFTNLLLEAMKGGAADLTGSITPGSIYAYIDQALGPWEQRPVFKTNVSRFIPLRKVHPRIPPDTLKKITDYFPDPESEHQLDSSYEYTNHPGISDACIEPLASEKQVAIFKDLQKMQAAGLVEPVAATHMYWAAMNGASCRLTALGAHYWRLAREHKL